MASGLFSSRAPTAERGALLGRVRTDQPGAGSQVGGFAQRLANGLGQVKDRFEHAGDASVAVLGGAFGGTFGYKMVQGIAFLRARAPVPDSYSYWAELARTDIYGRCYDGCSAALFGADADALLACPQQACSVAQQAMAGNLSCDPHRMWFWENRIPTECLAPIGAGLHSQAIAEVQRHVRHQEIWGVAIGLAAGWLGAWAALSFKRHLQRH